MANPSMNATHFADNATNVLAMETINSTTVAQGILMLLFFLCSGLGNSLIILVFISNDKMRTVTNTLVVNLCLTDLFCAVMDIPFVVLVMTAIFRQDYHMDNTAYCLTTGSLDFFLKTSSVISMCGIAIDRFFMLIKRRRRRMTRQKARIMIACSWIQSLIASFPWGIVLYPNVKPRYNVCGLPLHYQPSYPVKAMTIIIKLGCFILPMSIIYYIFYRILKAVRNRRQVQVEDSRVVANSTAERFAVEVYYRSAITAIILFGMFTACTMPFFGWALWSVITGERDSGKQLNFMVAFLFRLKGGLFPLIYTARNQIIFTFLQRRFFKCQFCFNKEQLRRQHSRSYMHNDSSAIYGASIPTPMNPKKTSPVKLSQLGANSLNNSTNMEYSSVYFKVRTGKVAFTDLRQVIDIKEQFPTRESTITLDEEKLPHPHE